MFGRKQLELQQKAALISDTLEGLLGVPTREGAGDVLECLILTILSQNTTDVNRDKGYAKLKERYPTWEDVLQLGYSGNRGSDKDCRTGKTEESYHQKLPLVAQN